MAMLEKEIGYTNVHNAVISAKNLLSKIECNPKWEDIFEKGLMEFKRTHSPEECTAFKAAIFSHTFWTWGNEVTIIPIPTEKLEEKIGKIDSKEQNFCPNVVNSMYY